MVSEIRWCFELLWNIQAQAVSLIKYLRSVHQRAHWTVNTFDMGKARLVTVKTWGKTKKHFAGSIVKSKAKGKRWDKVNVWTNTLNYKTKSLRPWRTGHKKTAQKIFFRLVTEHENFHRECKYQTVKKATLSLVRSRTIFPIFELQSDAATNHNGVEVKLPTL